MDENDFSIEHQKFLCISHIEDKTFRNFIKNNYSFGTCDYCNKERNVISLHELIHFISSGLGNEYGDAVQFVSWDRGFLQPTYETLELLIYTHGIEINSIEMIDDIDTCLNHIAWADLHNDYWYGKGAHSMWDHFTHTIKHKTRYFFHKLINEDGENITDILNEVCLTIKKTRLIKKVESGSLIFRCLPKTLGEKNIDKKDIVSPPLKYAKQVNRFSPSGISLFYGSNNIETCLREVNKTNNEQIHSIGELKLMRSAYMIDFTKLPVLPSIFNKKYPKSDSLRFLHHFVNEASQELLDQNLDHIEYVPTQVFTEYIQHIYNAKRIHKIDGIIYPSAKNIGGQSYVFFWDHEESMKKFELVGITER